MQQMYKRMTHAENEMKDFKLQTYLHKDSIKTRFSEDGKLLQISVKVDALCDSYLRINTCVTEQRDMNNVPTMMYTPNKDHYIQEMRVKPGMNQEVPFEKVRFHMDHIRSYELFSVFHNYYPLVISFNYQR